MHKHNFRPSLFSRSASAGITFFAAIFALAIGWPHQAFAAAATLGDMVCNVHDNLGPFVNLINALAWLAGGTLIGVGALNLKDHADSASNHPLHRAIAKIAAGAALMTAPFFAQFIVNTLFISPGAGGASACEAGGVVAANGGGVGLDVLITNLVNNIEGPLIAIVSAGAFVMGVFFIVRGLMKAAKYGTDARANSPTSILTYLVIGGILIALAENFNQIFISIFGADFDGFGSIDANTNTVLGWTAVQNLGDNVPFATAIAAALTFFQLVGLLAFFRGWYIVKNAIEGSGQATVAQGATHIVGGVLAINIYNMLAIFDTTFGTGLLG